MLRIASIALVAAMAAASVAYAATGGSASPRKGATYADAAARTLRAPTMRFAVDVRIVRNAHPAALHVRGATAPDALQLRLKLDDAKAADGTVLPGTNGAVVVDGPFLYERAPAGMVVGKLQWLRENLDDLNPSSPNLKNIEHMTPRSLLRILDRTHMRPTGDPGVFSGRLAYDDPVVRNRLGSLTGDVEFRRLRAMALVGTDGRVHRVRITGVTADGKTTLRVLAYLHKFGAPVKVKPPAQDTFLDLKREQLAQ